MHVGIIGQFQLIQKFHKVRIVLPFSKRIPLSKQNQVKAHDYHPKQFYKSRLR